MGAPTVPFYGKDSDRLAKLAIAHKVLSESGSLLDNWPTTVANLAVFKQRIDLYDVTHKDSINRDRRSIAARIEACNNAGITWQKMVNYISAMEVDYTATLELMGVSGKSGRGSASAPAELYAPDLAVVNLDRKTAVRASCSRERRRYTYEIQVSEADPRLAEPWYHKASFGDCTKMDMDGFQPGKEYSFRCRIIGRDNKPGPWSLPVTIMVT